MTFFPWHDPLKTVFWHFCQITQSPSLPYIRRKYFRCILWLFFPSIWIPYSLHYALILQNLLVANITSVFLWLPSVMHFCIIITNSAALSSACFSSWFVNIQLSCEQTDVKFPGYKIFACCFDASWKRKDLTSDLASDVCSH